MSAEKRARLKSNPVKVRFAEEVVVNGHTQVRSATHHAMFLPVFCSVLLSIHPLDPSLPLQPLIWSSVCMLHTTSSVLGRVPFAVEQFDQKVTL